MKRRAGKREVVLGGRGRVMGETFGSYFPRALQEEERQPKCATNDDIRKEGKYPAEGKTRARKDISSQYVKGGTIGGWRSCGV